jgi:hypothetical protein
MRFFGIVGYGKTGEAAEGVWVDNITERSYYGDVVKDTRRIATTGTDVNSDVTTGNSIEIIADPYALEHFHAIKYVEWSGALWSVTETEAKRPRIILRLGGVYDGSRPAAGSDEGSPTGAPVPPRRDSGR